MIQQKIDFKKQYSQYYKPSAKDFSILEVPALSFLMIDGHGNPNSSPAYQQAIEALYGLAYGIKFALKPQGYEYGMPPLEGLWWMPDMREFGVENKDRWDWTMMVAQPDFITTEVLETTRFSVIKKKGLPALSRVRLERYEEGLSVQILYFGGYADEGPTIARMHGYARENGYELRGKHHEIYLGDPRRNAPEKLKTIIRQPVQKVEG